MKIVIATNDRKTIAKRTGRAAEFAIFHIEHGEIISIEYQKNTHTHHDDHDRNEGKHRQENTEGRGYGKGKDSDHHHNHEQHHEHGEHSHDDIVAQLQGVEMFLLRAVGKYMKKDLTAGNIPYQMVKGNNLKEIITNYLKS